MPIILFCGFDQKLLILSMSADPKPSNNNQKVVEILKKYIANTPLSEDVIASEENYLAEKLGISLKQVLTTPSLTTIPKFYRKKLSDKNEIQSAVGSAARRMIAEKKNEDIMSNEDLDSLWNLLEEKSEKLPDGSAKLTYEDFVTISKSLPNKCQKYFRPSIFLKLIKDENDARIDAQVFFNFLLRRASLLQERVCISLYDSDGDGFLTEADLERYIGDLIGTFPQLESLETEFKSFYLCGAIRKFFFYLDVQRKGKIAIKDILTSQILSEFFELQQADLAPNLLLSNWFSLYSALKIYGQYIELDVDKNGMLKPDEFANFATGRYSRAFTDRVFQECQTFGGELDYKNYLDFVLTVNDFRHPQALSYAFKLLDINNEGRLDRLTVMFFIRSITQRLFIQINTNDFLNEIFDMANPKNQDFITLQDLLKCRVGGTIVSLLVDVNALMQNQAKD